MKNHLCGALLFNIAFLATLTAQTQTADWRQQALTTLKQAATYFRTKVATHGGYVYYYRLDLQQRWGEGEAALDTIFVQPPGTPTVGLAYLQAYAATGDEFYLAAARETAEALLYGQLESGGWTQTIHFGPAKRLGKYRHGKGGDWNASSLDDGQSQAALTMLMRTDAALRFKDKAIHEATLYGLKSLLSAQFENGAFPQVWTSESSKQPVLKANYPSYDWKTTGRVKDYWNYYTLNDGLAGSVTETLITAHEIYGEDRFLKALQKLGDFLILAQMPEPQPAWCQQYNFAMQPLWARKFEPPAIASAESQNVLLTLIRISQYTKEKRFLQPIPSALAFWKKSQLPNGSFARFYELQTNRPLYMNSKYELTYSSDDVPSHYGWNIASKLPEIEAAYSSALEGSKKSSAKRRSLRGLELEVKEIISSLDSQGRWVTTPSNEKLTGQPKFGNLTEYLSSAVFSKNIEILSDYLQATKSP